MSAARHLASLDAVAARKLTAELRGSLSISLNLLTEAWERRVWVPLEYPSWDEYCSAELPELRQLRLPVPDRRAQVALMRGKGMSTRAMASGLGVSVGTVHADLQELDIQLATVTSLDGRRRPGAAGDQVAEVKPRLTNTDRCVALVASAGADGLTWRELGKRAKWHHGQASGALSTVHRQGRLVRTTTYRAGCAVYVVPAGSASVRR